MAYDPDFIAGHAIPLPTLGPGPLARAFDGGTPIHHSRFSLVFDQTRGFAIYTAHNIDGATLLPAGTIPRDDRFRFDPEVQPRALQVDNDRGYRLNPWDRGHLVRRRALHWGNQPEAEQADSESYFWTNIVPQHETLHDTAWGSIEDWMLLLADDSDQQADVFTGPVLTPGDPERVNQPGEDPIQIPAGFWKVIAVLVGNTLRAAGFLVWQRDFDKPVPEEFVPFLEQVRITTLEYLTGLSFGTLAGVDPLQFGTVPPAPVLPTAAPAAAPIGVAVPMALPRPAMVASPADIYLG